MLYVPHPSRSPLPVHTPAQDMATAISLLGMMTNLAGAIGSAVAGVAVPVFKDIWDHFHKSSRREWTAEDTSNLLKIGSSVAGAVGPIIDDVVGHFENKGQNSRRFVLDELD